MTAKLPAAHSSILFRWAIEERQVAASRGITNNSANVRELQVTFEHGGRTCQGAQHLGVRVRSVPG